MKPMNSTVRAAAGLLMAGAAFLVGTDALQAQETEVSLGLFGGGFLSTDLNDTGGGELYDDGAPAELQIETSGLVGLQGEVRVNEWVAVRAEGGYAPGTLELEQPDVPSSDGETMDVADTDVWIADVNGVLQVLPGEHLVQPFVTAGAGLVHYDPEGDEALVFDEANARLPDDEAAESPGNDETQLAGMIGVGADVAREGWPVAIRAELTDHIASSPARLWLGEDDVLPGGADIEADTEFGAVHNLRLSLGLQWTPGTS